MIKKINLFDAFRNAMLADPKASRKEAFKHFLETVRSNPSYIDALAEDYFYRMASSWEPQKIGKDSYSGTPATNARVERSAEKRAEGVQRVAKATDELKARIRQVLLLDLTLPNGKRLRDATGAECAKAGGFYTEVARHLKPTQVVDKHMNEKDLRDVWSRYEGGRKGRGAGAELHA
jgi:hypothetical protein